MKAFITPFLWLFGFTLIAQSTYTNPLDETINLADPYVYKHGDHYYLYGTTASGTGFQTWKSPNLVDWEYVGWIFKKDKDTWGQGSFWAPEMIEYKGKFYLIYSSSGKTKFGQGMRICISVADHPEGPFKELHAPLFDFGYGTIDGHIYIEEDKPYLYYEMVGAVGNFTKQQGFLWGVIMGVELADDLSGPITEQKLCIYPSQEWEGTKSMWARSNEGMTVFKSNNTYYMMYSGNHWRDPNYGIGYATSDRPVGGLWTKYEGNPILEKDLERGISGPGHNSIIRSPDEKELFIVYHTHILKDGEVRGGRTINIDRLMIKKDGILEVVGPTKTPQPFPSGATKK